MYHAVHQKTWYSPLAKFPVNRNRKLAGCRVLHQTESFSISNIPMVTLTCPPMAETTPRTRSDLYNLNREQGHQETSADQQSWSCLQGSFLSLLQWTYHLHWFICVWSVNSMSQSWSVSYIITRPKEDLFSHLEKHMACLWLSLKQE